MAIINLDLVGSLAIHQRYEWRATLLFPGAISGSIKGAILSEPGGELLATLKVEASRFDAAKNETRQPIFLTAQQTTTLPLTGGGFWVYNVVYSRFGKPSQLLIDGKVHVLPSLLT